MNQEILDALSFGATVEEILYLVGVSLEEVYDEHDDDDEE